LPPLGFLALGDVGGDAADAHDTIGRIEARRRRPGTPTRAAVGAEHTELGLLRACALGHAAPDLLQAPSILGMNHGLDILQGRLEALPVHAKDAVLALVPSPFAGDEVPIPRAHLPGGERKTAALLALQQPRIRGFEFGRALGHATLEFRVQPLEVARLAIELGEYLDL